MRRGFGCAQIIAFQPANQAVCPGVLLCKFPTPEGKTMTLKTRKLKKILKARRTSFRRKQSAKVQDRTSGSPHTYTQNDNWRAYEKLLQLSQNARWCR
jgi:hypothetical protein